MPRVKKNSGLKQKNVKKSQKSTKIQKKKKEPIFKTKSGHVLTPKQEMFCQLFAGEREFFGNGVQSYIEAYDVDTSKKGWYATAKASAHENLTKPYILERINEIFEANGLNDQFVDKQLEKLIVQDADFNAKMKAIQEYNKLKSRITDRKDITSNGQTIAPVALVEFLESKDDNATGKSKSSTTK